MHALISNNHVLSSNNQRSFQKFPRFREGSACYIESLCRKGWCNEFISYKNDNYLAGVWC